MAIRKLNLTNLGPLLFIIALTIFSFFSTSSVYAAIGDGVVVQDGTGVSSGNSGASGLFGNGDFDLSLQGGVNAARGDGQPADLFGVGGVVSTITSILLFIIGALSVVMIIIGGLRYVTSGGNPTSVTGAKNTILYAVVGLVVAFLAYAAVNFVLGSLTNGGPAGTNV